LHLKPYRIYLLIFTLTIFIQIIFALIFPRPLFILDAEEYHIYATNILEGRRLEVFPDGRPLHPLRPPLYSVFITLVYFIFGQHRIAVYGVQIFLTGLTSIIIYKISLQIFNDTKSAQFASILYAFHLPTLINTAIYYPEILFTFTLILFVYTINRAFKKPTIWIFILTGFLIGLTTLVKPVVQFLPILILPGLYFYLKEKRWKAFYYVAILIAAYLITMSPWIIRNYKVYNTFVFCDTTGGINLYTSNFSLELPPEFTENSGPIPPMTEEIKKMAMDESISWPQKDKIYYKEAFKMIARHPFKMVRHSLMRIFNFYTDLKLRNLLYNIGYQPDRLLSVKTNNLIIYISALLNIILVSFAILSMVSKKNRANLKEYIPLILLIAYFTGIHALSNSFIRYSVAIFPYILIFAGRSISLSLESVKRQV
jgi:4-amino-4-deoxy-L-arabinose transferase-like glycosyltransferase